MEEMKKFIYIGYKKKENKKWTSSCKKSSVGSMKKKCVFLAPYLETRNTITNIQADNDDTDTQVDTEEGRSEIISDDDETIMNEAAKDDQTSNISSASTTISDTFVPKKRKTTPAQEIISIMKNNAVMRADRAAQNKKPELDEVDMFYLSMAKTVKKLPQIDQAKIRMKLCQLVSEAEIRQLSPMTGSLEAPIPSTSDYQSNDQYSLTQL